MAHGMCRARSESGRRLGDLGEHLNPDLIILVAHRRCTGVFYPLLRQNLSDRAIKIGDRLNCFSRAGADAGLVGTAGPFLPVILMEQLTG